MDSNIRHDNLVYDITIFCSLRSVLPLKNALFQLQRTVKDVDRHCLACGHQGLTAYVKASTSGFGVSEAALNIISYLCAK
jgi:hypothetical protein